MSGPTVGQRIVRSAYRGAARTLDVLGLKDAVRSYVLPRLISAAQGGKSASGDAAALRFVEEEVERALAAPGPIVVGPWMSEVGYELLYWIPFLRWLAERWNVPRERLIAVTRGGAGAWYGDLCGRSLDILELMPPEEFRALNEQRWRAAKGQKQGAREAVDDAILERARKALGLADGPVLHPSLMFGLFAAGFHGRAPVSSLLARLSFRPIEPPPLPAGLAETLPAEFVAVRFYSRPSFPDTPALRAWVGRLASRLGSRRPLVSLDPGLALDDHADFAIPGAISVGQGLRPAENLALQSAVIARSKAFVGTYGGLAYLAPFVGVPSLAFHADGRELQPAHREVMEAATGSLGARIAVLGTQDLDLIDGLLGR
jgi:hypothetical protein